MVNLPALFLLIYDPCAKGERAEDSFEFSEKGHYFSFETGFPCYTVFSLTEAVFFLYTIVFRNLPHDF